MTGKSVIILKEEDVRISNNCMVEHIGNNKSIKNKILRACEEACQWRDCQRSVTLKEESVGDSSERNVEENVGN